MSAFIKRKPSKKFPGYRALMRIQEALNQYVWRDAMVE